jgi:hypothetical protein
MSPAPQPDPSRISLRLATINPGLPVRPAGTTNLIDSSPLIAFFLTGSHADKLVARGRASFYLP